MNIRHKINTDNLLICLILLAGALLRFWNYRDIPFTHDEFSAVFRTGYESFHDLIIKGVIPDTHPAGVQVFLNYWIRLTGISEPLVKLPFTVFSLAAVYLVYIIGKKWFSSTAGLLAASFLAYLQYPLMYGQIARPYASGLFLVLLMVYFWTGLVLEPGKKFSVKLAGYVLASALCAYNHHFTLLFTGITALTGLFMIRKGYRKFFVLSWLLIFMLYMPHIGIFFSQLKQGGIGGWLSRPRPDFPADYLAYAFQFSWYVAALLALLSVLSIMFRKSSGLPPARFVTVAFAWFILPLLTGYAYSVLVNPVLQYSVLLFSFPFLLLFMFSYADARKAWQKVLLILLTAMVVISSLVLERKHYRLFYASPYREILVRAKAASDSLGRKNCFVLIDSHPSFTSYYLSKPGFGGFRPDHIHDVLTPPVIGDILDTCHARYFVYGCISNSAWEDYPMILSRFPEVIRHVSFNEGDFYVFSAGSRSKGSEYYLSSWFDPGTHDGKWENIREEHTGFEKKDSAGPAYRMDSSLAFSPIYLGALRDVCRHRNDVADFIAEASPSGNKIYMQLGIYRNDSLLSFQSRPMMPFPGGEYGLYYCSSRFADIDWRHHHMYIRAFIWNPQGGRVLIRKMFFGIRSGNPYLYSLYRKIGD